VSTKEKAEDLKKQIQEGADFGEIARKHSTCPSGQRGGDLGEFGRGQMVKEFDEVVFRDALDTVHGPVKTQFGYHLLEITSRTD
jgi:peptidyl-prolyl cis-trans isomerase C